MQKTDFGFEIFIHDDASNDGTSLIIRKYQMENPERIRLLIQPENQYSNGKGLYEIYTRIAFPQLRGKYIAICEGDDYWTDPLKLQKQVNFLESNPDYSICFHNVGIVEDGRIDFERNSINTGLVNCEKQDFTLSDLIAGNFIPNCSVVYRNEIIDYPDIFSKLPFPDWPLHIIFAQKGKIWLIPEFMANHKYSPTGLWNGLSVPEQKNANCHFLMSLVWLLPAKFHQQIIHSLQIYSHPEELISFWDVFSLAYSYGKNEKEEQNNQLRKLAVNENKNCADPKSINSQQIFHIELLNTSPSGEGNKTLVEISGWFYNSESAKQPNVIITADSTHVAGIVFHIQRPDVEAQYGKLNYMPGFNEKFVVERSNSTLRFINSENNKILSQRKLCRFDSKKFQNTRNPFIFIFKKIFYGNGLKYLLFPAKSFICLKSNLNNLPVEKFRNDNHLDAKPVLSDYEAWIEQNTLSADTMKALQKQTSHLGITPKISLLIILENIAFQFFDEMLLSLKHQIYPYWEVCLAMGVNTNPEILELVDQNKGSFNIRILEKQGNSRASTLNELAELTNGEWLLIAEPDGLFEPDALFEFARVLQGNTGPVIVYSDEDYVNDHGKRFDPVFKPDWSYVRFLSSNYLHRPVCINHKVFEEMGGFRENSDQVCEFDLLLRISEVYSRITHLPKVLYHNRSYCRNRQNIPKNNIATTATEKALREHIKRKNYSIGVYPGNFLKKDGIPVFQLDCAEHEPTVEIIIPAKNNHTLTQRCINSIFTKTAYQNYNILLIDNESDDPKTLAYYNSIHDNRIRIQMIKNQFDEFSFGFLMNEAVKLSLAEYLIFLNNDIEIIEPRWLNRMMAYQLINGVGAVGARLLFPDGSIQHAGVFLGYGLEKMPDHIFRGWKNDKRRQEGEVETSCERMAVTAACMLTSRNLFLEMGGFNQSEFAVCYNDVDYCIRLHKKGFSTVFCSGATLLHFESMTRNNSVEIKEILAFHQKYKGLRDPFFNQNLKNNGFFEVCPQTSVNYSECIKRPLKILFYSHNFNNEGAPKIIYHLAKALIAKDYNVTMVSPYTGIEIESLTRAGIKTLIFANKDDQPPEFLYGKEEGFPFLGESITQVIQSEKPDLVFVNVLFSFYVVNIAASLHIPCVWMIHESFDVESQKTITPHFNMNNYAKAFQQASSVIFCTPFSEQFYQSYNVKKNFRVIRNSIGPLCSKINLKIDEKTEARKKLNIKPSEVVVLNVGSLAEHKNQELLVRAAIHLKDKPIRFFLAGSTNEKAYVGKIKISISESELEEKVILPGEIMDIDLYYKAADIFCFVSTNETYPLAVLEAMAFGLPVIATPINGVNEQVRFGINALKADCYDAKGLAANILKLAGDEELRHQLGRNSKIIFDYLNDFDEMVSSHEKLILDAFQTYSG